MPPTSNADDYFDDKNFEESIDDSIDELVSMGLVTIVGINEQGEWLYATTDKGRKALEDGT